MKKKKWIQKFLNWEQSIGNTDSENDLEELNAELDIYKEYQTELSAASDELVKMEESDPII